MTAVDLAALPPVVIVRGIASWLGVTDQTDSEPAETYEDYLNRISQEAA
ncbi:hypothetical protein AB5J49_08235 [Streptomyces sp. R28]|uniref:Uncharacterized protein n=1 Tax=Streptomyces sp. R28 TaxID=3238628 RepID=A0AB39PTN0_9ACTN